MLLNNTQFIATKNFAWQLREKVAIFQHLTKTNKQIFINLITTFGLTENEHSGDLIDQVLTLDDLFVEV